MSARQVMPNGSVAAVDIPTQAAVSGTGNGVVPMAATPAPSPAPTAPQQAVARNLSSALFVQGLIWAISWAMNLYLPNYLGAVGLGYFQQASAWVANFGTLIALGVSMMLLREVAREPARAGEFLAGALLIRVVTSALIFLAALLIIPLLNKPLVFSQLIFLLLGAAIIGWLSDVFASTLQGLNRMGRGALGTLCDKALGALLVLVCIWQKLPYVAIGVAAVVATVAAFLVNASAFRTLLPTLRMPDANMLRLLAIGGLPFLIIGFCRTYYLGADALLLGLLVGDAAAGYYSIPLRLLQMAVVFPSMLCVTLTPTLTRLYREDEPRFRDLLLRVTRFILLLATPLSIAIVLVPHRILFELLPYSAAQYTPSVPVAAVLGCALLCWFLTQIFGTTLIVTGRERSLTIFTVCAMALTFGGLFIAIPIAQQRLGNGAVGAGAVDALVETFMLVAMWFTLPRAYFPLRFLLFNILRCAVAAVPLALLLCLTPPGRLWIGVSILAGGGLYALLCIALKSVEARDLTTLRQMISRGDGKGSEATANPAPEANARVL